MQAIAARHKVHPNAPKHSAARHYTGTRSSTSERICSAPVFTEIASAARDVSDSVHRILYAIVQDLTADGFCYLPLTYSKDWLAAIGWALSHPQALASDHLPHAERYATEATV